MKMPLALIFVPSVSLWFILVALDFVATPPRQAPLRRQFLSVAKKRFNAQPFAYHQELELEITTLTNLGVGLGRVQLDELEADSLKLEAAAPVGAAWVVMVPFALPGERVRVRVFRNHKNYSEADLVAVLTPSPHRVPSPRCPLFGRCGGCQYQHLVYGEQLEWKRRHVTELLRHMAGVEFVVAPVIGSPRQFGYRSKITPHFAAPGRGQEVPSSKCQVPKKPQTDPEILQTTFSAQNPELETQNSEFETLNSERRTQNSELKTLNLKSAAAADCPVGFLRQGSRHEIIDVPRCEIATDAINVRLAEVRADVRSRIRAGEYRRGATLLLRDAGGRVTTDYAAVITEEIAVPGPAPAGSPGSTCPPEPGQGGTAPASTAAPAPCA